jgi:hypothetical protein
MKPRVIDCAEIKRFGVGKDGFREVVEMEVEAMSGAPYTLRLNMEQFVPAAIAVLKHLHSIEGGFQRGIGVVDPDGDKGAKVSKLQFAGKV